MMISKITAKKLTYADGNIYSRTLTKLTLDSTVLVAAVVMFVQSAVSAVIVCVVHFLESEVITC